MGAGSAIDGFISTFEVLIRRVHVDDDVLMDGHADPESMYRTPDVERHAA